MELRHLRYFVAVGEELHFGRAAERLFLSQPPLSQQIQQLERELGVTLLARTNRRVELTEAGRLFLEEARAILERTERAVARTRRAARGEEGWIGVGFVASATYDLLPKVLRAFRERYPAVELVLMEMMAGEQGEALREGRIHIGFARLPLQEEGVRQEVIAREPLAVALPAAHPLALQETIALPELTGEPFVLYPRLAESTYAAYILEVCRRAGFEPRVAQETGEIQTAISLVVAGIGVSLVPTTLQSLRREGLVYRPLTEPGPTISLTLSYRESDASPVLPRFREVVYGIVRNGEYPAFGPEVAEPGSHVP